MSENNEGREALVCKVTGSVCGGKKWDLERGCNCETCKAYRLADATVTESELAELRALLAFAESDAYRQRCLVDELRQTIATKEVQWLEMNAEIEHLRAKLRDHGVNVDE